MANAQMSFTSNPPVVIGGVGGSGTRLIAECLKKLGYFIGGDLNQANDNLWFTLLFKRVAILTSTRDEFSGLVDIFLQGMTGAKRFSQEESHLIHQLLVSDDGPHPEEWRKRWTKMLLSKKPEISALTRWGWKEPNAHIILDRLLQRFGSMRYIHVMRNGLDMAFSNNQNQLKLWSRYLCGREFEVSPYYSLKYWCAVHRRVLGLGKTMERNFLLLNYDHFCQNPERGVAGVCDFLGVDASEAISSSLVNLVRLPDSMGRFKQHDVHNFDPEDLAFVQELGFDTASEFR